MRWWFRDDETEEISELEKICCDIHKVLTFTLDKITLRNIKNICEIFIVFCRQNKYIAGMELFIVCNFLQPLACVVLILYSDKHYCCY